MVQYTTEDAPLSVSMFDVSNDVTNDVTNANSTIVLRWDPPSDRNGSFNTLITYSGTQIFNYDVSRVQSISRSLIIEDQAINTLTLSGDDVLPFADYSVTVTPFNRLFGQSLSAPEVLRPVRTVPTGSSNVTDLAASTRNSTSILVQWVVPTYPNGQISRYQVFFGDSNEMTDGHVTNYVINGLTAGTNYTISIVPITDQPGSMLRGTRSLSVTVLVDTIAPDILFDGTISEGVFDITIALPSPSLFDRRVIFYGVLVVREQDSIGNNDVGSLYDDAGPHTSGADYYIAAGWNDGVPATLNVGDGSRTTALFNNVSTTFVNRGLNRRTSYQLFVVAHLDSGVPGEPLVRYIFITNRDTRLGYNEGALGFFMALIILLIIIGIVVAIVFVFYKKRRSNFYKVVETVGLSRLMSNGAKPNNDISSSGFVVRNPPVAPNIDEKHGDEEDPADEEVEWVPINSHEPISIADFPNHVANMHSNDDYLFSVEYPKIEPSHAPTTEATHNPNNAVKNRYANITAYDHSRVRLSDLPNVPNSDYINANYIHGYKQPKAFIASQGPVPQSINDYWRMIWEQNVATIVMLTNLEEKGRIKCHKYWPGVEARVAVYGSVRVQLQEELFLSDHTIRTFTLQQHRQEKSDERVVKQFHFTAWPDFGVPEHPTPLLRFIHKVSKGNPSGAGPMIVHCSAGVGRTGTFITVMCQMKRIVDQKTVDIFNFVQSMRRQRCFMVQTEAQYIFIHDALLEVIECGQTEMAAREVKDRVKELGAFDDRVGKTLLEAEFERIQTTIHKEPVVFAGAQQFNRQKNRYANVIPFDKTRCRLSAIPGVDGSDYINANFIEGYLKGKAYIATQGALPDTVDDFWRMVWEHKSSSIVMLANERENGKAMCHRYWPEGTARTYGAFEIHPYTAKEYPDFTVREFKIVDTRDAEGSTQHVKQFQFTAWPSQGVPDSAIGLLDLREQIEKWQRNSGDKPMMVHCSGGCGRTGTFIAVCLLIDRLKTEGTVDIFQTVRGLRLQRPGMVRSVDQYDFCYKAVLEYLGSFDTYANFSL